MIVSSMDDTNTAAEEKDESPIPVLAETNSTGVASNDAILLIRIEEMIKTHISQMENLSEEITKYKEMVDDIFGNDQTFQEHDKIAKEAAKVRSKTKAEIMKRPDVKDFSDKLQTLKSEKNELEEGLSDYLREYQRLSGSNEIEGDDGQIREIVYTAKLIKKPTQFR